MLRNAHTSRPNRTFPVGFPQAAPRASLPDSVQYCTVSEVVGLNSSILGFSLTWRDTRINKPFTVPVHKWAVTRDTEPMAGLPPCKELAEMSMFVSTRGAVIGAAALALASFCAPAAIAQSVAWDWGGGSVTGGSGKEVVSFPVSAGRPGDVIVSFGDRRLYFITRPGEALAYPIAIPREKSRWSGMTTVTSKRENPSWTPTPTMRAENPRLPNWVPGGHPMNPLGVRALYLGSSAYRIHGTDAPWTIGSAVSKGCVRMYNQDVLDLYPRVRVGARVNVTWNRYSTSGAVASSADPQAERPTRRYTRAMPVRKARSAASAGATTGE